MSVGERDPHTGYPTTGHEWNGITELNRPVPKVVWWTLGITVAFSIVYWILMPAWPLGTTYTRGLLGIDQRDSVQQALVRAQAARADWAGRIAAADFSEIQEDETLMRIVQQAGSALYGDNCAVCHGPGGKGSPGYPSLVDGSWLWGGDPETIHETLRVGINSTHPETRVSEMLAFGRNNILDRDEILNVAAFVQSLSDPGISEGERADAVAAGEGIFAEHCVVCHGDRSEGSPEQGAPNLADGYWIYGGDLGSIYWTVFAGRQGHMPHWEGRLSETERKMLTLYVLDLAKRAE